MCPVKSGRGALRLASGYQMSPAQRWWDGSEPLWLTFVLLSGRQKLKTTITKQLTSPAPSALGKCAEVSEDGGLSLDLGTLLPASVSSGLPLWAKNSAPGE